MRCRTGCCLIVAASLLAVSTVPRSAGAADSGAVAAAAQRVLKKHCYACHGENGSIEGGMNFVTEGRLLVARGKVVPKNPGKSAILRRIRDGEMPPADAKTKLTEADIAAVANWIKAGAAPFQPAAKRPFITEAEIDKRLRADLAKVSSRSQRFIRYFTITHLYNAGLSDDELQTYRNALSKLINSLSWNARVIAPQAVDPAKTVFRVDLRDYKWTRETWQKLLDEYPYGVELTAADSKWCYKHSTSRMPRLRADWFVAKASQPPLYHDLLGLPQTDVELEKQLRIGVRDNIEQEKVIRAGFNGSGVSTSNRLIERHDSPYGAYWKSYDFAESRGRQNLFAYPLGPYEQENCFKHDGGEIIFSLPNGLHGYLLVDNHGRRIDKGPSRIVSDPKRPDRRVVNGLSCMSCHARGLIDKVDQVRPHVVKNAKAFSKKDREYILAMYKPRDDFRKAFKQDVARFQAAVKACGAHLGKTEPIVALARRFEEEVDLHLAACEAGIPTGKLAKGIQNSRLLARKFGPLNINGGTVQRDVLATGFRDMVRELKLGKPLDIAGEMRRIDTHVGGVNHIRYSPDGKFLVTSGGDRTVRIWNARNGQKVRQLMKHPDPIRRFAISPDGKLIATGCKDGLIRLFDFQSGKLKNTLKGHTDMVFDVVFTPDSKRLLSGSMDRTVRVWSVADGKPIRTLWGHRSWVRTVDVSADGKLAVSSGNGLIMIVWDLKTWRPQQYFLSHHAPVTSARFVGKSHRVVSGGYDNAVRYWNLQLRTERLVKLMKGHTKPVSIVEPTPDEKFAISAGGDGTARLWHLETGREVHRFGKESEFRAIALSPNGKHLASADGDGTIHIFGVPTITVEDDGTIRRTSSR